MRLAFASLLVVTGCVSAQLDRSVSVGSAASRKIGVREVPVHGFVVRIDRQDGLRVEGELLAVDEDRISILPRDGTDRVIHTPRREIEEVEIRDIYKTPAIYLAALTTLGSISTISHGFVLLLTLPVWLATGVASSINASEGNDILVRREQLDVLSQYARFPQGLPPIFGGEGGPEAPPAENQKPAQPPGPLPEDLDPDCVFEDSGCLPTSPPAPAPPPPAGGTGTSTSASPQGR